ncbi:IS1634 family transposase [Oscillatoria sp. CS-180]|uniref:IS1634 family transposase n=1 Tax=Oscillatoria sp. CS-180 TaxID=3021720 RepID=UPI00232AD30E|nr:IS1634 family transposase [Oscillatoria sp. CS-180]MDB9524989.1 IS1634 family transposase [Oscillatoria sp. CS-180]
MNKPLPLTTERVDDIPLLLAQLERMGVQRLLDEHFPTHGNWQGLSLGTVAVIWLSHILSQADHRLNHVQPWVEGHQETLRGSLHQSVRALDLSDDRLECVLRYLSEDEPWREFETALSQQQIQVYDLSPQRLRLDSTTVSGDWCVSEGGLFQYGVSKDHRPDLPQLKLMLASLDPLGMPVASEIVAGNRADDPLYIPAIERVRQSLPQPGLLYVGDCKMASLQTRVCLQAHGDFYLCPLGGAQLKADDLQRYLAPIWEETVTLQEIYTTQTDGTPVVIACGYEQSHPCTAEWDGQHWSWLERRLVVCSLAHAEAARKAFTTRIEQAQSDLEALNQSRQSHRGDRAAFQQAAEAIVRRHRVTECFHLDYREQVESRPVRRYRDQPSRVVDTYHVQVHVTLDTEVVQQQMRTLGWRVYVTNHPLSTLSLEQAVLAYRQEYRIERGFGRLKGHPLSLTPMYLQREDHIQGLIRLLSIALRLLTLMEFQVRRALANQQESLAGLYVGNPKRATAHPTTELLLAQFRDITLTLLEVPPDLYLHITPLTSLQQKILALLNLPESIYSGLEPESANPL